MTSKLDSSKINILNSADDAGLIEIPCGTAVEIESCLKDLLQMERAGLVSRVEGTAFFRAFVITAAGRAAVKAFAAAGADGKKPTG